MSHSQRTTLHERNADSQRARTSPRALYHTHLAATDNLTATCLVTMNI